MSPTPDTAPVVRAAGGAVVRPGPDGDEVVLVHRPRYDDWSLPKGKVDRGEADVDAALREVFEETGLRCRVGGELPETRYVDHNGRPKLVRYWVMDIDGDPGEFEVNDEVDALEWLPLPVAMGRLTYDRDRVVLAALAEGLG